MMKRSFRLLLPVLLPLAGLIPFRASAQVALRGKSLSVETSTLSMVFQGSALTTLRNKVSGESYITQVGDPWISVNMVEPVGRPLSGGTWRLDMLTLATIG